MSGHFSSGAMSLPMPGGGSALVTPQAGVKQTNSIPVFGSPSRGDIEIFFDKSRYHGKCNGVSQPKAIAPSQMITTKENIKRFFDPLTYSSRGCQHGPQKRTAPSSEPSSTASAPKPKVPKMTKEELLQKFKLAAELNGLAWEEFAAPQLKKPPFQYLFWPVHFIYPNNPNDNLKKILLCPFYISHNPNDNFKKILLYIVVDLRPIKY